MSKLIQLKGLNLFNSVSKLIQLMDLNLFNSVSKLIQLTDLNLFNSVSKLIQLTDLNLFKSVSNLIQLTDLNPTKIPIYFLTSPNTTPSPRVTNTWKQRLKILYFRNYMGNVQNKTFFNPD